MADDSQLSSAIADLRAPIAGAIANRRAVGRDAKLVENVGRPPTAEVRRVPNWYRYGMSKQITVRLSDELVAFVDELVDSGAGRSRAAVVSRVLTRERRRAITARDAEILWRTGPDPELHDLAEHAVGLPSDLA